jgi:plasmid stabilization system protein ParE
MALTIEWRPQAQRNLDAIYDYLEQNHTEREINRFSETLEQVLSYIVVFPFMYRQSKLDKTVRLCVLTKQVSLIYKVKEDRIVILLLFDNRQDPNRLKI